MYLKLIVKFNYTKMHIYKKNIKYLKYMHCLFISNGQNSIQFINAHIKSRIIMTIFLIKFH